MTTADLTEFTWRKSSFSGNDTNCVEIGVAWRKSSFSGNNANCVEVGHAPARVGIRDTKNPDAGALTVTPQAFAAFRYALLAGR